MSLMSTLRDWWTQRSTRITTLIASQWTTNTTMTTLNSSGICVAVLQWGTLAVSSHQQRRKYNHNSSLNCSTNNHRSRHHPTACLDSNCWGNSVLGIGKSQLPKRANPTSTRLLVSGYVLIIWLRIWPRRRRKTSMRIKRRKKINRRLKNSLRSHFPWKFLRMRNRSHRLFLSNLFSFSPPHHSKKWTLLSKNSP